MVEIRPMTPADWPAVDAIYAEGIATGAASGSPSSTVPGATRSFSSGG